MYTLPVATRGRTILPPTQPLGPADMTLDLEDDFVGYQELHTALHKVPFEPFRIQLTNGQALKVEHPDFAWLTRTSVLVGFSSGRDEVPDRFSQYDLLHVVGLEPLNGHKHRRTPPKRRPRE